MTASTHIFVSCVCSGVHLFSNLNCCVNQACASVLCLCSMCIFEEEEQRKGREREERFQQIKQADQQAIVMNTEEFECPICTDDIEVGEGLILKQCLHQVCK